jgi:hypothetical protein
MRTSVVNTEVGLQGYTVPVYTAELRTLHDHRRENINFLTFYLPTVSLCPLGQQRLLMFLFELSKEMEKVKRDLGGGNMFSVRWTLYQITP